MRKVVYGAACSLDGFIAGADGSIDWLHFSDDVNKVMTEYFSATDTLVMGRKTWEVAAALAPAGGASEPSPMQTYVFSRTLKRIDQPGVQLVTGDAGGFMRGLKKQKGKNIIVLGGGDFARSLFEADVIDEVGLNIHPIVLGSGVPFFLDAKRRIKLALTRCRQLSGECVLLDYRVKHSRTSSKH
ncbi:MAG: dihydrofolate reductase family protein [Gemmatimonadaceae bacterium]